MVTTKSLVSEEYQPIALSDAPNGLSASDLQQIESVWRAVTSKAPTGFFDYSSDTVQPKNWTGTITSRDVTLRVFPRGALRLPTGDRELLERNVTEMLRIAISGRVVESDPSSAVIGRNFEGLVASFLDVVESARRRRVIRSYRNWRQSTYAFRGRILFPQQALVDIRTPGRIATESVNLDEDTAENRFLRCALERARELTAGALARRASALLAEFDAVPVTAECWSEYSRIRFDRLEPDYAKAVRLASDLLRGRGGGMFDGSLLGRSEVVYTPDLFEAFVARMASEWGARSTRKVSIKRNDRYLGRWTGGPMNGRDCFRIEPDIEAGPPSADSPEVVIDTKWKVLDRKKPQLGLDRDDVYQIAAYTTWLRSRRGVLLYPALCSVPNAVQGPAFRLNVSDALVYVAEVPLLWNKVVELSGWIDDTMARVLSNSQLN